MGIVLTDNEVAQLLTVEKTVSNPNARWKTQSGSEQRNHDVASIDGKQRFKLFLRQNCRLPEGFSCGLIYLHPNGEEITITRYNGSDHAHRNPLDSTEIFDSACHIHIATERYMSAGRKPEHYAEQTDRYSDLPSALRCLLLDCKIAGMPDQANNQMPLL